MYNKIE